jgi:hypothetical protein
MAATATKMMTMNSSYHRHLLSGTAAPAESEVLIIPKLNHSRLSGTRLA